MLLLENLSTNTTGKFCYCGWVIDKDKNIPDYIVLESDLAVIDIFYINASLICLLFGRSLYPLFGLDLRSAYEYYRMD